MSAAMLLQRPGNIRALKLFSQSKSIAPHKLPQGRSHNLRLAGKPAILDQNVQFGRYRIRQLHSNRLHRRLLLQPRRRHGGDPSSFYHSARFAKGLDWPGQRGIVPPRPPESINQPPASHAVSQPRLRRQKAHTRRRKATKATDSSVTPSFPHPLTPCPHAPSSTCACATARPTTTSIRHPAAAPRCASSQRTRSTISQHAVRNFSGRSK